MTATGWMFMLGSISFVLGLLGFCVRRVLIAPPNDADSAD